MQFERFFCLDAEPGSGVLCDERGLFVGDAPLLERDAERVGAAKWRSRPLGELNLELAKAYDLPIAFDAKMRGLATVAGALNSGDVTKAQIAALLLQLPDPPALTKSDPTSAEIVDLVGALKASNLLHRDWDPTKHPRWAAGSPGGVGGQFAPSDEGADTDASRADASRTQAQLTLPVPLDVPLIEPFSPPSEIVPPIVLPNTLPRSLPQNPYPSRPKCRKEWAEAEEYCRGLSEKGLLGKGDYRGMGKTVEQCMRGRVSQDCGGNGMFG
ncbi:MAG: hypothetical protein E7774_11070 [Bradyrhizobium sp.]|nr:MAG: hypothetical protein E7774_11070 [Bradyrhizobium sp.]